MVVMIFEEKLSSFLSLGQGQRRGAEIVRHFGVLHFIEPAFAPRSARLLVSSVGRLLQMFFQMRGYLMFGFFQKAEAPFIAEQARADADGERAGIPHWVEQVVCLPDSCRARPSRPGVPLLHKRRVAALRGWPGCAR